MLVFKLRFLNEESFKYYFEKEGFMVNEEFIPDDIENKEALTELVADGEMKSEEEGFLHGYNEDIEPDRSDEEGLDDDEKIED